jgi:hypothetical protein
MRSPPSPPELTSSQRRQAGRALFAGLMVRGLQLWFCGWGAWLALFGGRGWVAFLVAALCAAYLQTCLPTLPDWAEKQRPDDG